MKKRILMYQGDVNELAKHFKVSRQTIHAALTYKTTSRLSFDIRNEAFKRGGIDVVKTKTGKYEEIN